MSLYDVYFQLQKIIILLASLTYLFVCSFEIFSHSCCMSVMYKVYAVFSPGSQLLSRLSIMTVRVAQSKYGTIKDCHTCLVNNCFEVLI